MVTFPSVTDAENPDQVKRKMGAKRRKRARAVLFRSFEIFVCRTVICSRSLVFRAPVGLSEDRL